MIPVPVKKPRYYGLFISSMILKAIIVITVLMMLGGLGYLTAEAATLAETGGIDWRWWLPRVGTLLLMGGGFAFFCFILSQLIDIQLSLNERLNQLAERINLVGTATNSLAETAKSLEATQKQVTEVVDRQNRLLRLRGEEVTDVPPRLLKK